MINTDFALAPSEETGRLGLMHLKRFLQKSLAIRDRLLPQNSFSDEWRADRMVLAVAGLGLEQAIKFIYNEQPTFEAFEKWIVELNNGRIDAVKIDEFNKSLLGNAPVITANTGDDALTQEDLNFWEENGYVILRNAVPVEDCDATVEFICNHLEIDISDANTWYKGHKDKQGIMVQLFQHRLLEKNRTQPRIRKAFEQLWKRPDIWHSNDRTGFNPPVTPKHKYQGVGLHWDVSLHQPIPFGTQGILYLTDTAENQGAFTLVPGFQHKVGDWLQSLPAGTNPRNENLYALGAKPIAANAGDLIIWHQALPHDSSPNTSQKPRIVQYINYRPIKMEISEVWI